MHILPSMYLQLRTILGGMWSYLVNLLSAQTPPRASFILLFIFLRALVVINLSNSANE